MIAEVAVKHCMPYANPTTADLSEFRERQRKKKMDEGMEHQSILVWQKASMCIQRKKDANTHTHTHTHACVYMLQYARIVSQSKHAQRL